MFLRSGPSAFPSTGQSQWFSSEAVILVVSKRVSVSNVTGTFGRKEPSFY